jgi:D-sedoheptulose 7-phosphate isomerase
MQQHIEQLIKDRIQRSIAVKQALLDDSTVRSSVAKVTAEIVRALSSGGTIFFFGNGGSAADAQHLAAEFTGRYLRERSAWPAMALSVNTSSLTAIGNDYGFDIVFARQLEAFGRPGDVAVGITTSGNSPNVVRALETAKSKGMFTVALTGGKGGLVKKIADCALCVRSAETPRIQECHILLGHVICEIVEQEMIEATMRSSAQRAASADHF